MSLLADGKLGEAVRCLRAAVTAEPRNAQYHGNLAVALRRAGDAGAAVQHCRAALALAPRHALTQYNLGCALFDLSRHDEALAAFDLALALKGDDPEFLSARGDALRELGRIDAACDSYTRALALDPRCLHAHRNLAPLLTAQGRFADALVHCERAVEMAPQCGTAWLNLGWCLFRLERFPDAMDAYATAYEHMPDSPLLCRNIGWVWIETADPAQAALWFGKALELDQDDFGARFGLAVAQARSGDPGEAARQLRAVVADRPEHVDAWCELGKALLDSGRADEAVDAYRTAQVHAPAFAGAHVGEALVHAAVGRLDAAVACHRRALEVAPDCASALNGLALALRGVLPDADAAHIEALLARSPTDEARSELHDALANLHDARGHHARAALHVAEANRAQAAHRERRGGGYDPDAHRRYVDELVGAFDAAYFERCAGQGDPSEAPVFVVGMPRSGTTLTERILACHPRVVGVGERELAAQGFMMLPRRLGSDESPLACVGRLHPAAMRASAAWHLDALAAMVPAARADAVRIVDKMPENYLLLGWIATLFPRARIIHCRRDPRDIALSCWFTRFSHIPWACDLEHIDARLRDYHRLMAHWRAVLPVPLLELDYEALVTSPEAQSRRMIEWLGLSWDAACLSPHASRQPVRTASATQVCHPVHARSVGRWRHYRDVLLPALRSLPSPRVPAPVRERTPAA